MTVHRRHPHAIATTTATRGEDWRELAACHDHPDHGPATFDDQPEDYRETPRERAQRITRAKAVCERCPVGDACLATVDITRDDGIRNGIDLRDIHNCGQCRKYRDRPFPELVAIHVGLRHGPAGEPLEPRTYPLPREHGTDRGYHQHHTDNNLPACDACLAAHAERRRGGAA